MTYNILITSAGRRVSLVRSFRDALKELEISGKVFVLDCSDKISSRFVADGFFKAKRLSHPEYISDLLNICIRNSIKLIIPTIDTELLQLSQAKKEFEKNGITILVPSESAIRLFLSKKDTNIFFTENNIPCPKMYENHSLNLIDSNHFPLFIKPKNGSSSKDAFKVRNHKDLEFFCEYISEPIVEECLVGEEITIDVLIGKTGKVLYCVPRKRIEVRDGEVSKAITIFNNEIISYCKKICSLVDGIYGCINIQCFLDKDSKIKFFEVNPRFGGGFPLSLASGANFPKWILEIEHGKEIKDLDIDKPWKRDLIMLRFDEGIFVNKQDLN